ncbi:MAG TPA: ABC transporter permease [Fimbriimonadaceae bacterium]|nr:ABC transporter permease [Fimbriimonadaceae bacterium]HRJ95956.1 ABC transporter permease [Fimbriimonadaceae bacterium]
MQRAAWFNLVGLIVAWVILFIGFSLAAPHSFPTLANLELLARQSTIVALAVLGTTFVIASGGIDLSVGSVVALVTVVIAGVVHAGYDPALALVAGLLAGGICGLLNGGLIVGLRVTPFIVTLGTLLLLRGLAKGLANEQKIDSKLTWLNDLLQVLGKAERWKLVPVGVWVMLVLAVVLSLVLARTVFGRQTLAVGSNEMAARYAGIPVAKVRLLVYVLGGVCSGLAGLMQFSRLGVGDPTVAIGLELNVIAAAVIGGASLSGGRGSIAGSLLGALIMSTIASGSSQMGLPNWVQEIVTGAIIVLAVALDHFRQRVRARAALPGQ